MLENKIKINKYIIYIYNIYYIILYIFVLLIVFPYYLFVLADLSQKLCFYVIVFKLCYTDYSEMFHFITSSRW